MKNSDQKLAEALTVVRQMKLILEHIYTENTKLFKGNKELANSYKDTISKIEAAILRLLNPVLSIATIGTTSAGKSTIVNGLTGRTVAPMESQEMSAGVLRLIPDSEVSLEVAKSKNWEYGIFKPITDKEVYTKIEHIFEKYQKIEKITTPPEITVRGPLLWDSHPELIDLPKNLSIEFIDLPGLKTLTDVKNLAVIQKHLSQSLCLVAMDYNDVDPTRIKRLLEELEDIIKAMAGNDDSILFLLNKVDARSRSDKPLKERIGTLTEQIHNSLSLKENTKIKIIPFISRLLYYAQSAIGNSFYNDSQLSIDYDLIGKLILDHANTFNSASIEIKEIFNRISNCYEPILDEYGDVVNMKIIKNPDVKDIVMLVKECYRISHADTLFSELKRRIQESFTAVVIQPATHTAFKALDEFIAKMRTYIVVNRNDNFLSLLNDQLGLLKKKFLLVGSAPRKDKNGRLSDEFFEGLLNELNYISTSLDNLCIDEKNIKTKMFLLNETKRLEKEIKQRPIGEIDKRISSIETNTTEIANKIIEIGSENDNFYKSVSYYLSSIDKDNSSKNIFIDIIDVPKSIKEKLDIHILIKIKNCLEHNEKRGKLEQILRENLAAPFVSPVLPIYEVVRQTFEAWKQNGYTESSSSYTCQRKSEILANDLKAVDDMYILFNLRVRELLSNKTDILFQLESEKFIRTLRRFLQNEFEDIIELLNNKLGSSQINLSKYIETTFENLINKNINLPKTLFDFTKPSFDSSILKGTKQVQNGTETYTTGGCCPKTKTRVKYKTIQDNTYTYSFSNANGLYNAWHSGISESESLFWVILSDWINEVVKSYMAELSKISLESVHEINQMIIKRIQEITDVNSVNTTKLNNLEKLVADLEVIKKKFKQNMI